MMFSMGLPEATRYAPDAFALEVPMVSVHSHSAAAQTACRRLLQSTIACLVFGLSSRSLAQPPPPPPPLRVAGGHDVEGTAARQTLLAQGTDSVEDSL
jgi:hypothetical protein